MPFKTPNMQALAAVSSSDAAPKGVSKLSLTARLKTCPVRISFATWNTQMPPNPCCHRTDAVSPD
jgi:hypothetical protein